MENPQLRPGEIRFHRSAFIFQLFIFAYISSFPFFLAWKTSRRPPKKRKIYSCARGNPLHLATFHFCVHIIFSFFFLWKTPHPLFVQKTNTFPPTLAPNKHFNYWSPLCATCILHLTPIKWVGHCQQGSLSISCLDKKRCEAIPQTLSDGPEISRMTR